MEAAPLYRPQIIPFLQFSEELNLAPWDAGVGSPSFLPLQAGDTAPRLPTHPRPAGQHLKGYSHLSPLPASYEVSIDYCPKIPWSSHR